ncbi:hypothetical protein QF028_004896 [Neobacillus sp. B4I6]|nr:MULTISPECIES: hypothetical protein [unclassified Bacillus (in: firmicutes)]
MSEVKQQKGWGQFIQLVLRTKPSKLFNEGKNDPHYRPSFINCH